MIKAIVEKSLCYQRMIAEAHKKFRESDNDADREVYMLEILSIFDNMKPIVEFVKQNEENVNDIIKSQHRASQMYEKITGHLYESAEEKQ